MVTLISRIQPQKMETMPKHFVLAILNFVLWASYPGISQAQSPIERALSSTVVIRDPVGRMGSGFFIRDNRTIVTNVHVLAGMREPEIILSNGKSAHVEAILAYDEANDIVIAKVTQSSIKPIRLASSLSIKLGERVFAIGSPAGLSSTITSGIVSAVRSDTIRQGAKIIQTDAAINPGNSGGPLVNETGEVIGVVSSKLAGASNLGFAAHIDVLNNLVTTPHHEQLSLSEFSQVMATSTAFAKYALPQYWVTARGNVFELLIGNEKLAFNWLAPSSERHIGERTVFLFDFPDKERHPGVIRGIAASDILCVHPKHGSRIITVNSPGLELRKIDINKAVLYVPIAKWNGEDCQTWVSGWEEIELTPAAPGTQSPSTGVLQMLKRAKEDRTAMVATCNEARAKKPLACQYGHPRDCGYYSGLAERCARDGM